MALPLEQPLPCTEFAALEAADRPRFQIDDLCVYLESYLSAEQIREVYRAYQFGAEAHAGQTRTSPRATLTHWGRWARILRRFSLLRRIRIFAFLSGCCLPARRRSRRVNRGS